MRIIGIIPSRYASTRFPGKPLAEICGQPMIAHVVERAKQCRHLASLLVATDDERVAAAAREAGAGIVMTPEQGFASGSDRVAFAARDLEADVVVNIQGDEPLLPPSYLDRLLEPFVGDPAEGPEMATLAAPFSSREEVANPRTAKVVLNARDEALYFSRAVIPHPYRSEQGPYLRHIGVYAYRKEALLRLAAAEPSSCELVEGLEQLRALNLGFRIRVVRVSSGTIGVDTPEDLERVVEMIRRDDDREMGDERWQSLFS